MDDPDFDPHFGFLTEEAEVTKRRQLEDFISEIRDKLCVFLNIPIES